MGRFDIKYLIQLFSCFGDHSYLKNSVGFLSDFCSNKNKNKPVQSQLSSLFQDSERVTPGKETNNTSYESLNTQLF